jgi:hypothetical protein
MFPFIICGNSYCGNFSIPETFEAMWTLLTANRMMFYLREFGRELFRVEIFNPHLFNFKNFGKKV